MAWDDFANGGNDLQDNRSIVDNLNNKMLVRKFTK